MKKNLNFKLKNTTMKALKFLVILFITTMAFLKVNAQDTINKQEIKHVFTLPAFTGIDVSDASTVFLSQGDVQSVKSDDYGMDLNVKDGILKITPNATATDGISNSIFITSPKIKVISTSGVAKVKTLNTLNIDTFNIFTTGASEINLTINATKSIDVIMGGASNVTLKGNTSVIFANLSGACNLTAKNLKAKSGVIIVSGISNAKVNITEHLEIQKAGMGKVTYENKPKSTQVTTKPNGDKSFEIEFLKADSLVHLSDSLIRINDSIAAANPDGYSEDGISKDDMFNIDDNNLSLGINVNKNKFKGHWAGFDLGFNGYVDKNFSNALPAKYSFMKLKMNNSMAVNINFFKLNANIYNNRLGIVSGLGLQYNNYWFDNDVVLTGDSSTIFGYHTGKVDSYIKSKLTMSWLRVPLFLEYQTSKANHRQQFHISAGAVFGYRIGSHSKQVYVKNGDFQTDKIFNDFYLNQIKLDAEVRIGWGPINLFASYAVSQMFQSGKGPEVYPYIVGITLVGW